MAEETAVAAPSAAVEAPKFTQFDGWDDDGNPVVTNKAEPSKEDKPEGAEPASADASKETKTDDVADSAAKNRQEKTRRPTVEERFKKLTDDHKAEVARLQRELEEARKPKAPSGEKETKAESSTARQNERQPALETRPKPKFEDKGADGKPLYGNYEEFQEAVTDWRVEQKLAAREREQQAKQVSEALQGRLEEARGRYADYDSVAKPLFTELMKPDISREVISVLDQSPVLADLLYVIGGTEASKADFLDACRNNPGKALRVALLAEQEIAKELGKGKTATKPEGDGKATPAEQKPRAPKPPTEVGGRGAPGEDALISAAKAGNFRDFDAEMTRRALASRR
ncbi:hypothetical protein ACFPT7_02145 [Acidicapsa dinghuensis]|uniref:Scaffolding protein n=1 Tax=Acidicapsa dinghuensis TaxID=2218256 RepID=A0ABW1E9S7_9BACT|nr:hypothetical protein [Acidicapsa dinghuensis]